VAESKTEKEPCIYQAPIWFVSVFYGLLGVWTLVCVVFLGPSLRTWASVNLFKLFMIAFILFYIINSINRSNNLFKLERSNRRYSNSKNKRP